VYPLQDRGKSFDWLQRGRKILGEKFDAWVLERITIAPEPEVNALAKRRILRDLQSDILDGLQRRIDPWLHAGRHVDHKHNIHVELFERLHIKVARYRLIEVSGITFQGTLLTCITPV